MTRPRPSRVVTTVLVLVAMSLPTGPAVATCGGGGGGGMGGATGGGRGPSAVEAYHVPWTIIGEADVVPAGALAVYWFPTSAAEAKASSLLSSRTLTLASARCVAMALITSSNAPLRAKFNVPEREAALILVDGAGAEIGRVASDGGVLAAPAAEKLVTAELDKREEAAKGLLDAAKDKLSQKDDDGAAAMYTQVWQQHCLLPDPARKAAKALKKLGQAVEGAALLEQSFPLLTGAKAGEIVRAMNAGLAAERDGRIEDARRLYETARRIDPADAVPVRFLGELLRHEIGDWDRARVLFEQVLAMPADSVSRAVALHGLGKMTIHEGRFAEGLALFQRSLDAYPLALTYRNLAVYWNSEKDHVKAHAYVKQAIELEPDDEYNQIFAATYLVELGRPDEARDIALRFEGLLAASYNLAVIHAQLGEKDEALDLLRRHFTVYERFEAVRAKEMQEARDDVAFAALQSDPGFVKMTALADQDPSSYHRAQP